MPKLLASFQHYLAMEAATITRAAGEQRMLEKLTRSLTEDIVPLLPAGIRFGDEAAVRAFEQVWMKLVARLPGDGWKSTGKALVEMRTTRYPSLLAGVREDT